MARKGGRMSRRITFTGTLAGAAVAAALFAPSALAGSEPASDYLCGSLDAGLFGAGQTAAAARGVTHEPAAADAAAERAAEVPRRARGKASAATFATTIDVHFHVINAGPSLAEGNISDATVRRQVDVLDSTFGGSRGGVATPFSFELASIDRTTNAEWFNMGYGSRAEREAKQALHRGGADDLNIYSVEGAGFLGWATFPSSFGGKPLLDGVVIAFGSVPGGSIENFDLGFTATHEVGHWLGLFHTFQNGCSIKNDEVADTPAQGGPSSGCPVGADTCRLPGLDPIHNYMDYSDDACYTEFTAGQSERMTDQFVHYRAGG
jgi:Pregnancy-associated plasma protein-A